MGRHRGDAVSYLQHHLSTVERGALGTFASLGSAAVSMVSHLEVYLRIAGLCVGLAVGIVTLYFRSITTCAKNRRRTNNMNNWKTTTLGVLTALIAFATGAKEFLSTGSLPDIGLIAASLAAAWGLVMAKDNNARG
jgi:hypothetical protein